MLQTHLSWDTAASNDGAFALGSKMRSITYGTVDTVYCLCCFDSKEDVCYALLPEQPSMVLGFSTCWRLNV